MRLALCLNFTLMEIKTIAWNCLIRQPNGLTFIKITNFSSDTHLHRIYLIKAQYDKFSLFKEIQNRILTVAGLTTIGGQDWCAWSIV